MRHKNDYYTTKDVLRIIDMGKELGPELYDTLMNKQLWLTKEMAEDKIRQHIIERINGLEEEFFLTVWGSHKEINAAKEANRLKMLILKELELI